MADGSGRADNEKVCVISDLSTDDDNCHERRTLDDVIRVLGPLGASVYGATLGVMKACLRGGRCRKRRSLMGRKEGENTSGLGMRSPKSGSREQKTRSTGAKRQRSKC